MLRILSTGSWQSTRLSWTYPWYTHKNPSTVNHHRIPPFYYEGSNKAKEYKTDTKDIKFKAESIINSGQSIIQCDKFS